MLNETKSVNINIAPGYTQDTAGRLLPEMGGNNINVGGESLKNCWIDYPIIPGQHQFQERRINHGSSTTALWTYPEYTRWTSTPDGTHQSFKIELPGVVMDDNFSVDISNNMLVVRSKRFDSHVSSCDSIKLNSNIELNVKKATATFRACILEVQIPFTAKTTANIKVKVVDE